MRHSYPNEPIGGGNPYYCCSGCGISDPEINGRPEKHASWCIYRNPTERLPLSAAVFLVLSEYDLEPAARKILETAYYEEE